MSSYRYSGVHLLRHLYVTLSFWSESAFQLVTSKVLSKHVWCGHIFWCKWGYEQRHFGSFVTFVTYKQPHIMILVINNELHASIPAAWDPVCAFAYITRHSPLTYLIHCYDIYPPGCQMPLWCKDWWVSAEWAARPSQPIRPTSTNQKTHFAIVNFSLMHFTLEIQVPMNPFCAKNFKN